MTILTDTSNPTPSLLGTVRMLSPSIASRCLAWLIQLKSRYAIARQFDRLDHHRLADVGIIRKIHIGWEPAIPGFEPTPTARATYEGSARP